MHDFPYYLNEVINFFLDGMRDGFAHVNAALGLIIAVVAAFGMSHWKRLWAAALGATIVHLLAVVMLPVLANNARFALPPDFLHGSYWRTAAALYLGYVVVIAVFFFLKKMVLSGKAAAAH